MENVQIIMFNDSKWFKAKDVAESLGYKNTNAAIKVHVLDTDKRTSKELSIKNNKSLKFNTIFINEDGLKSLVVKSRMINATSIAKGLGVNTINHKYECKEIETITAITKAFKGEKMRTQYPILTYRIDLYFPDYNLCIECDENGHNNYNHIDETKRHDEITKTLTCKWIRFNPDDNDFNIFNVINQIFTIIKIKL